MKCKYFKTRTKTSNKKRTVYNYCTLLRKEVPFSCYQECDKKEYKQYKQLQPKKECKMKNKSSKLAKLERNRFSVFTTNLDKCYLCPNKKDHLHEIFAGRNRQNSMKYGFVLPICWKCHEKYQNNAIFNNKWHNKAQQYFEKNLGNRQEFIEIFRESWL